MLCFIDLKLTKKYPPTAFNEENNPTIKP